MSTGVDRGQSGGSSMRRYVTRPPLAPAEIFTDCFLPIYFSSVGGGVEQKSYNIRRGVVWWWFSF